MNIKIGRESNRINYHVVVIGAGANGSHFIRSLCQDVATYCRRTISPFDIDLYLVDGDRVEEKNIKNQLFDNDDIGDYKVQSLADRYGSFYHLDIRAVTEYVTDIEFLKKLFVFNDSTIPILVGMVDNNRTRALLHNFFYSDYLQELIYVDTGVEGVLLEEDLEDTQPEDREKMITSSGYSGQVVIGYKRCNKVYLPPVADIYPTILDDDSHFPGQSCGDLIISQPQRCATNKVAAQLTNTIINNLFHSGEIFQNQITFNAQFGISQAQFVQKCVMRDYISCHSEV